MPHTVRPQKRWNNTLGRGSCAFNAFGSRLFCGDLLDAIEQNIAESGSDPNAAFLDFINLVVDAAEGKIVERNWEAVRSYLIQRQATNPFDLQRFLTPVLRELFRSLALDDKAEYERTGDVRTHYGRTIENLLASYKNFVDSKLGVAQRNLVQDDIFSDHQFISDFFETIFRDNGQYKRYKDLKKKIRSEEESAELLQLEITLFTEQNAAVLSWWQDLGYRNFLDSMATPQLHKWAGDLELYLLAKYFRINLKIDTHGVHYYAYINHGSVSREDATHLESATSQLVTRGIINNPEPTDTTYSFLKIDTSKLTQRLSKLPNYDVVLGFINAVTGQLKGRAVPKVWDAECVEELRARDIITTRDHGKSHVFYVNADDAKDRMKEVPAKETIVETLLPHIADNPTMDLTHYDGHYEYVPPPEPLHIPNHEEEVATTITASTHGKEDDGEAIVVPESVITKMTNPLHDVKDVTEDLLNFNQLEPNQAAWEANIAQVLESLELHEEVRGTWIKYSFLHPTDVGFKSPGVEEGYVTQDEQMALDEEFAKALQKKLR